ncbi:MULTISPECIES: LysM domain-containing protein [unclassified Salinibacterium]|uniref:LysM peptidoglycan-binding domain-containing protein n=1 Tax=unclassified Salinibacterium TaxID=2632331 RepID=UPI00143DBAA4|nr:MULTISPECIES: LysM domain-containing protein [unclassified Salinibacterium]
MHQFGRLAAAALACLTTLSLAACSFTLGPRDKAVAKGTSATPSAPSEPVTAPPRIETPPPGTLLASGVLTDGAGAELSTVTITQVDAHHATTALALDGYEPAIHSLYGSPESPAVGDCLPGGLNLGLGSPGSGDLPFATELGSGDPSFIRTILLIRTPNASETEAAAAAGCLHRVIAVAPLMWHTAEQRTDLHPVDAGSTNGARGTTESADGTVQSYTVAKNDTMSGIAQRFGITGADIRYLNPARISTCGDMACAGEVLNLDRARR